jgi:hypothetical protein
MSLTQNQRMYLMWRSLLKKGHSEYESQSFTARHFQVHLSEVQAAIEQNRPRKLTEEEMAAMRKEIRDELHARLSAKMDEINRAKGGES